MKTLDKITSYISKHETWSKEMAQIRAVFTETELSEDLKWGAPSYQLGTKIIAGFMGFKNHMGVWFHQGVFLKDKEKKLVNAQEEKTKALRQWRIKKGDVIDDTILKAYIEEAILNCKAGKEIKPQPKKKSIIPIELQTELGRDIKLKNAFLRLSPGKQNEYCAYILEAKREATKETRVKKIVPLIMEGKGLHDKYKKC